MRDLVEAKLINNSSGDHFRFSVECEVCHKEVASNSILFAKAGTIPTSESKELIYSIVYDQELHDARIKALGEIYPQFSLCPVCKRIVCNTCFLICEDIDMCSECASQLNEQGTPVN